MNRRLMPVMCVLALLALSWLTFAGAQEATESTELGDAMINGYFRAETARLADACLADVHTLDDWTSRRDLYRRQLAEMLGLDPVPERTDLKAVTTGNLDHEKFTVENVQFQSSPGLYVTGNLYIPKDLTQPAPAVLYVCGHAQVKKDGVSYGNKAAYQHHGGWFARNGYVCLTIDTVQLGEIEGLHHGTYRENMWWWNARGYTPAGVEAWNGIRALDYLQSRPEVDGSRLGITGRSGGGAYSWWIAALDERIKVAVPVAGITDLEDHVVNGCVEGHCDCMYMVNTYRWDYAQVAALVAPRPLLITNTDKDSIFPLGGVQRVHERVKRIYDLYGAADHLGLQISEGPHKDIQELQLAAFHWFNRFLKDENPPVVDVAVPFFEPEQLKVFSDLPRDQVNGRIHELFGESYPWRVVEVVQDWQEQRDEWMHVLTEKCFRGWPAEMGPLDVASNLSFLPVDLSIGTYDFTSQDGIRLRMYAVVPKVSARVQAVAMHVGDGKDSGLLAAALRTIFPDDGIRAPTQPVSEDPIDALASLLASRGEAAVLFAPRGVGRHQWNPSPEKQIQYRRRFMLLGQTLAGMQIWDVRRAVRALGSVGLEKVPIRLHAEGDMATIALYASLFEPSVESLELTRLANSHMSGPDLLNVLRHFDIPAAVAMAAETKRVTLSDVEPNDWAYPQGLAKRLGWQPIAFTNVAVAKAAEEIRVTEDEKQIQLVTSQLEATINKQGYVSGVAGGSFVDRKTGFRDAGYGLDIVDWIMEPGSDESYRGLLPAEMVYEFGNLVHGSIPKRSIEGPQICTKARQLEPRVIRAPDFVAVEMQFHYLTAAPGRRVGSLWTQRLVFPAGKRYFISSDRIDAVNDSEAMFLRVDMPGHIKHTDGDTFSEIYLSYLDRIPSNEFLTDFPPDGKFLYRRDDSKLPQRMIRAYHLRDATSGAPGPWLAGMTLDPADVAEAWCHERGYVCLIEEFGGRAIKAGESFSAAFVVGFFDSIDEMHQVYDEYAGHSGLEVDESGWRLTE